MFIPSWGGWRPGAGRKAKYNLNANIRIGIVSEICAVRAAMRKADRLRQYNDDPSRNLIGQERGRIQHHIDRHADPLQARRYFAPHSKAIDALGRLRTWVTPSYTAEAIAEVAARHNLPVRVVRDCYREFRKDVPEPEQPYTVFDTLPRPLANDVRKLVETLYRKRFWRLAYIDPDGELPLPRQELTAPREREIQQHENAEAASKVARHEYAERNRRKPEYARAPRKR
jgi:hypothetical protein